MARARYAQRQHFGAGHGNERLENVRKPFRGHPPDDPRYAQLLALVNSQSYRRYFDQSIRGVQAGGGEAVAFLSLYFYRNGQETLQMELCSEPGSVIRIDYQNAGPWPGGRSGAELFGEAMEILGK